ncbi:MAG TPA: fatty acid oxidation complex subunit alpha FadJ [Gemmatimonadaceae bacterium]|nr:fatty acid oxidation complex subunit alpha FadJ [Gemmatimonadaceae bacterium]
MTALNLAVSGGVAVVTFDLPDESVNKFTRGVIAEFAALLDRFDRDTGIKAAVLMSGKSDVWIAGADIDEFLEFKTVDDAARMSAAAQALVDRVERGRVPVIAAIHGACVGGGLELALACAHRIITDHPKTVLALPETQLGLIPGIGGTQRLPRRVGLQAALDMILSARNVRGKRALQSGLVDDLVHPAILRDIAMQRAREFIAGTRTASKPQGRGAGAFLLESNPLGRAVVLRKAREMTREKSHGNYPALDAAIDAVAAGYSMSRDRAYAEEARLFGEMAMTAVSKELVFLFYATTSLKKDYGGGSDADHRVRNVGVLGTGFMGAGIAAITAQQNIPVRFKDAKHEAVLKGLASVRDVLKDSLVKKRITKQQLDDQMSLVSGTTTYDGFRSVDLVIEAVFEDINVKHAVLRETEQLISPSAIFATNTSTIPIARIASASLRPEHVIGMHFFSPVPKMPLLEVIMTPRTAPEAIQRTVSFGRKLGKTVIVVNDSPGFYVNRILSPYINEAGRLLDEGVAIDAVDKALVDFGFPVGPITLIDEVGLDIAGKSGKIMFEALGDRLSPARSLTAVLEAGRLGRKGRKGFYSYGEDGEKGGVDATVYDLLPTRSERKELPRDEIQRRCVLAMVNEAVRCLEEGILQVPRDGDVGAVFGIGFPPFRGGPFRYADSLSAARVVELLERLDLSHAGRYTPAPLLISMARQGQRFYPLEGRPVD